MADPEALVSSLASAVALAASGYLFAVGVGRIKVNSLGEKSNNNTTISNTLKT